ncbi:MAG: tRNA lysidine(34) synthetase TilS [Treponema sp.]|nr:tRNA lysidine(34) synthetase TilS [Treponema sp.]
MAALSGGADSTAMVTALAAIRDKTPGSCRQFNFTFHALYVNHGIRPAAVCNAEEEAVAALCKKLNILLDIKRIPPGAVESYARQFNTGIEGAARHFRYLALREEARHLGADAIFTAHTADDRLETILMAFLRGSGSTGLGTLDESKYENKPASPPVLRPLLSLNRTEVLDYLKERGLSYCIDETNNDERFFRNKVRHTLIPFLDQHFPRWRHPVLRLGETQAMTAAFLSEEAEKRLAWVKDKKTKGEPNTVLGLSEEIFFSQPEILREEALFKAIDCLFRSDEGEQKKPRRQTLRSFIRGKNISADLGQCRLEKRKGRVTVRKTTRAFCESGFSVLIKSPGVYKLKELDIVVYAQPVDLIKMMDPAGIVFWGCFPLALRSSNGTILAEDRQGKVAVIRSGKSVWIRSSSRDDEAHAAFSSYDCCDSSFFQQSTSLSSRPGGPQARFVIQTDGGSCYNGSG